MANVQEFDQRVIALSDWVREVGRCVKDIGGSVSLLLDQIEENATNNARKLIMGKERRIIEGQNDPLYYVKQIGNRIKEFEEHCGNQIKQSGEQVDRLLANLHKAYEELLEVVKPSDGPKTDAPGCP